MTVISIIIIIVVVVVVVVAVLVILCKSLQFVPLASAAKITQFVLLMYHKCCAFIPEAVGSNPAAANLTK